MHDTLLRGPVESGLRALIGVRHELHIGAVGSGGERHPQRVEDQVGAHVRRDLPAITRRENTSITNARNPRPSQQRRYVRSPTHSLSGAVAVKFRLTRSGRLAA
jgi:hypothetical protein